MSGGHLEQGVPVLRLPGGHRLVVAGPVPRPLLLRDDQVKVPAEGLGGRVPEDPLGAAVPQRDDPVGVAGHDRLGGLAHDRPGEPVFVHAPLPSAAVLWTQATRSWILNTICWMR